MGGNHSHGGEEGNVNQRIALTSVCAISLVIAWILSYFPEYSSFSRATYILSYVAGAWFASKQAIHDAKERHITVDMLMLIAAFGAFVVGEYPEGAFLLFLFSLSSSLENLILGRTRKAIERLVELNPTEANVLRNGQEVRVHVSEVLAGERVIIRPGERVPIDGKVMVGNSSLDESPLTGESVPVDKTVDDLVFAGTLNMHGSLEVECQRKGEETTLARLVKLVEEAQGEKAGSETVSRWFGEKYTIAVILLGFFSFLAFIFLGHGVEESFYRAMTVLVVASPCAIVISVPAAILAAIANAARNGVLIKGGVYLERLAALNALAFDKTGTFTKGKPEVVGIFTAEGFSEDEFFQVAGAAEKLSEHPLAKSILREAEKRQLTIVSADTLRTVVGKGVVAEKNGERIFLGKKRLFQDEGIVLPQSVEVAMEEFQSKGWTTMILGRVKGGAVKEVLGVLAIADTLRPFAADVLKELGELGLSRFIMLTGDNPKVAAEVARQLGSDYVADLLPEGKLMQLKQLRSRVGRVAMIGDGINDAPSLAAADVGLSLSGSGSGVALEAADVVLMGEDLRKLPYAVFLAKRARVIIWQNLVFASGMMICLLIASFGVGIRMPLAVVGHEGSTVLVILNGLRLLWVSPSKKEV